MKRRRFSLLTLSALMMMASTGCVMVKPTQRGHLAEPAMLAGMGEGGLMGAYRAKFIETKTAAGMPGNAPGGGCGCSQ